MTPPWYKSFKFGRSWNEMWLGSEFLLWYNERSICSQYLSDTCCQYYRGIYSQYHWGTCSQYHMGICSLTSITTIGSFVTSYKLLEMISYLNTRIERELLPNSLLQNLLKCTQIGIVFDFFSSYFVNFIER